MTRPDGGPFARATIDLNADVGEIPGALADGTEEQLIAAVSSINIACGGHAGDADSMRAVIALAARHGVAIGAHPGYPDPVHFGRVTPDIEAGTLADSIASQVSDLIAVAEALGARVRHVKPHGALYNDAADNRHVAELIGAALLPFCGRLRLVGRCGSSMLEVWAAQGHSVIAEAFADRRYEPDGRLRARTRDDALIDDPDEAARQAVELGTTGQLRAVDGTVIVCRPDTLCLHGDAPGALTRVLAVRRALEAAGVRVAAWSGCHR